MVLLLVRNEGTGVCTGKWHPAHAGRRLGRHSVSRKKWRNVSRYVCSMNLWLTGGTARRATCARSSHGTASDRHRRLPGRMEPTQRLQCLPRYRRRCGNCAHCRRAMWFGPGPHRGRLKPRRTEPHTAEVLPIHRPLLHTDAIARMSTAWEAFLRRQLGAAGSADRCRGHSAVAGIVHAFLPLGSSCPTSVDRDARRRSVARTRPTMEFDGSSTSPERAELRRP